jgi:hypothetical protein
LLGREARERFDVGVAARGDDACPGAYLDRLDVTIGNAFIKE